MITIDELKKAQILIIEDDAISIKMLEDILKKEQFLNVQSVADSRNAVQLYQRFKPDAVLLDLNMPHFNGFEVMEQIKNVEPNSYLPVIMITEEDDHAIRLKALQLGARDFINKPYDRLEVLLRIQRMLEVRLLGKAIRQQNNILEETVKQRTLELYDTRLDVIRRLSRAAEFRDKETGWHVLRMSRFSACLAQAVGMSKDQVDVILTASPLHDIGKIAIPDHILLKPGELNSQEWEIMKNHTKIGAELLSGGQSVFMKIAESIALTHHERWDGTGYPNELKETQIPLAGRICGLCDVFDALTSNRPYKSAWPIERAVEEIKSMSSKHFDPGLVQIFLKILPEIKQIQKQHADSIPALAI